MLEKVKIPDSLLPLPKELLTKIVLDTIKGLGLMRLSKGFYSMMVESLFLKIKKNSMNGWPSDFSLRSVFRKDK